MGHTWQSKETREAAQGKLWGWLYEEEICRELTAVFIWKDNELVPRAPDSSPS